jgi:phosphotriesterase-related protein
VSGVATVDTVRGPVELDALGRALMHEHIFIRDQEGLANFNHAWGAPVWDEEERVADAVARLQAVVDAGYTALVDPTAYGLGRDVRRIARVNEQVPGLNIVVCTGLYAFAELPGFLRDRAAGALTELFVREVREGIDDTGIRAAFLKCAVERHGIVVDMPLILDAIAATQIETGVPLMVHTNAVAESGLLALQEFGRRGVDPRRMVIAHAGDSNDLDYLRKIADTGAALGFDRFNIPHFNPDEKRIETLLALVGDGYLEHIHLAHDAACWYDFMQHNPPFADERPDYLHIEREVLPVLRERGVTQEQLDTMFVENPKRFFAPAA